MRLHRVGPAVGGLSHFPFLRDVIVPANASPSPAPLLTAALAAGDRSGAFEALWQSATAIARRMGQRVVEARIARAQRLIESETRRLFGREARTFDRDAVGSRYY